MALTLFEIAKVELAKREAEKETIRKIYEDKGKEMLLACQSLIKDEIIPTMEIIFGKSFNERFGIKIYDGRQHYEKGEVVIKIEMKYGYSCADAGYTTIYLQPTNTLLLVSSYFDMRNARTMDKGAFVSKMIDVGSRGFRSFIS